jgi:hypothetical protein
MIALNSVDSSRDELRAKYKAELVSLLEATNDGLDVFAHFAGYFNCEGQPRLDRNYPSPFPLDKKYRPGFRLTRGKDGDIVFNDFATGHSGDCFRFVRLLLNYSFKDAVGYIRDSVLGGVVPTLTPAALVRHGRPRLVERPALVIEPWLREPMPPDLVRYDKVGITPALREQYHCYLLGGAWVRMNFKDDGTPKPDYTVESQPTNPLYGYWYPEQNKWKLNRPLHPDKSRRWGPNSVRQGDAMFGEHLLPDPTQGKQPLGIIAPGQRDSMALAALMGCWVGCLGSESAHLTGTQFGILSACFEQVLYLTDNDKAGERGADHLQHEWGLRSLNSVVHALGENDLCAWLVTSSGQRPDLRAQVSRDLWALASSN